MLGSPDAGRAPGQPARPFIFDTGLAPAAAAAALAALASSGDTRAAGAWSGNGCAALAGALGVPASAGAVLSVPMPSPQVALAAQAAAREDGSGWAASGRRRCPTASPGCGSPASAGIPDADWARAADVLARVVKEHGAR